MRPPHQEVRHQALNQRVRDEADHHSDRDGEETQHNRHRPQHGTLGVFLSFWWAVDIEDNAAHENDGDLSSAHNKAYRDKYPILGDPFENIELIVEPAVAVMSC
jgi:hypothetical protein